MVVTSGNGRMGNLLLLHFFSLIIQHKTKLDVRTSFVIPTDFGIDPLPFFDKKNLTNYSTISEHSVVDGEWVLKYNDIIIDRNINTIVDIVLNEKNDILLDGYFQKLEYFEGFEDMIKDSFKFEKKTEPNTVGIHLRKDDITGTPNDLPDEWFIHMANKFDGYRKILCTDSPDNPLTKKLVYMGCELFLSSPEQTLITFSKFSNLVLSQGTFSWWMGFLSEGNKHVLIPNEGWNSKTSPITLLPKNDKKWIYYDTNIL